MGNNSKSQLVVQGNQLINARYELTLAEKRIMLLIISQIEKGDEDFHKYRIWVKDFADALDTDAKNLHSRAKGATQRILSRVFHIPEKDGVLQVSPISSAKYYDGKGYIDIRFDPALKPYLLQLKEQFTSYDLRNVLSLRSIYSIRIYELLKQYERIGRRKIKLKELRGILGLKPKQYKNFNDFKRFIILQAQKELNNHCDISFSFEQIRKGRKVVEIEFTIISDRSNSHKSPAPPEVITMNPELLAALREIGFSEKQANSFIQDYDERLLWYTIEVSKKGTVKNSAGYFRAVIDDAQVPSEFKTPIELKEEERKRDDAKKLRREQDRQKREIERYKQEYDVYRKNKVRQLVEHMTRDDEEQFEKWIEKNDYASLISKEMARQVFIGERMPREEEDFISWMMNSFGIIVKGDERAGYVIVGHQEELFPILQ